jgi:hypothetical protein
MKHMGLVGLTRLLAQNLLRQERSKCRKKYGKGSKRHADRYAGLITENMVQLGFLHYNESEPTG